MMVLAIVALAGCRSAKVTEPLPASVMGSDPQAQMDFWHAMPGRAVASNDEAMHAILLFIDNEDTAGNYDGRVWMLKRRELLPESFDGKADEAVQRGTLAVMIVNILDVKGGVTMHLLGATPRYATRELMYMNLYPPSSPQQTFSGAELLGIIGRLEDYQRSLRATKEQKPHEQPPLEHMGPKPVAAAPVPVAPKPAPRAVAPAPRSMAAPRSPAPPQRPVQRSATKPSVVKWPAAASATRPAPRPASQPVDRPTNIKPYIAK